MLFPLSHIKEVWQSGQPRVEPKTAEKPFFVPSPALQQHKAMNQ